jgi:hypothetical protein
VVGTGAGVGAGWAAPVVGAGAAADVGASAGASVGFVATRGADGAQATTTPPAAAIAESERNRRRFRRADTCMPSLAVRIGAATTGRGTLARDATPPMLSPQAPVPAFTGLVAHHDPTFNFALFVPDGWLRLDVQDQGPALRGAPPAAGVFYAPDASDSAAPPESLTGLAIQACDLHTVVRPSDMPALRRGFLAGLRQLPESRIESRAAEAVGSLITLEARHTFRDGDAVQKRWVRLLYQDCVQVRLIAQAASVAKFAYWEPMFYTAMRSVRFGDQWSW